MIQKHTEVSVFNSEGPPVPIPNTEVKLVCAENTWLETARENRSMLTHFLTKLPQYGVYFVRAKYGPLAQLVRATGS